MSFLKKIFLVFLPFIYNAGIAQQKDSSENIIIYGDSFLFSIHEPKGWHGDVDNAKNLNANILFYRTKEDLKTKNSLIQVLTYKKQDEQVDKDLEYELASIKEKNPKVKEQNLDASSAKLYDCFAKLAYAENELYQYIAYINPGTQFRNAFSVIMTIQKRAATKEELAAFREVVSTLVVFRR